MKVPSSAFRLIFTGSPLLQATPQRLGLSSFPLVGVRRFISH